MSSPASSTPATDGKRIVSYFGSCGLFYYDLNGKELWKHPLPTAVMKQNFGTGVSPIIADGLVILVRDVAGDAKIIAVDLASGKLAWEKKRLSPVSYGTPVVWQTPAGKEIVAPGHARLIAYDLKKGAEKWSVSGIPAACCTSPVAAEGILFFAGGTSSSDDEKVPALDAKSGQETGKERLAQGLYYASPVAANGHIYFTALADGTVTVLKLTAGKLEVAATNPKLDERVGATPAIADNTLYIRTAGHNYAFAEKK